MGSIRPRPGARYDARVLFSCLNPVDWITAIYRRAEDVYRAVLSDEQEVADPDLHERTVSALPSLAELQLRRQGAPRPDWRPRAGCVGAI
jgi:hypothetical protein